MSGVIRKQNNLIHSPPHSDTFILIKNSITYSALLCFLNGLNKAEKKPILQLRQKTGIIISMEWEALSSAGRFSAFQATLWLWHLPECQDYKNNDSIHRAPFGTHFLFISFFTAWITLPPKGSSPVPLPMNINHLGMQKKPPLLWQ